MKKKNKKLQGYIHEMMDRISIIECNIEDFLLKNPACKRNKGPRKKIEKAARLLAEAYQDFGAEWDPNY